MNHTPTPWQFEPKSNYDDGNLWVECKDRSICRIDMPDAEDEANAKFIITACNAHEELVATLKGCLSWLSSYPGGGAMTQYDKVRKLLTTIEKGAYIMGCDIHCYVEYKHRSATTTRWSSFGGRINPGRDYQLFNLLAGVRGDIGPLYPLRGVPNDLGYYSAIDYWLYISDVYPDSEGSCSKECACAYAIHGSHYSADGSRISNPDWHSHSWLTTAEYSNVIDAYYQLPVHYPLVEYRALLAAMRSLDDNHNVRIVFWFDN